MPKRQKSPEIGAIGFYYQALEFMKAGDSLIADKDGLDPIYDGVNIRRPCYFLYCHSFECLMKALLLTTQATIEYEHGLIKLKLACDAKGLLSDVKDQFELNEFFKLLDTENLRHAFRYRTRGQETSVLPELSWVSRVLNELVSVSKPLIRSSMTPEEVAAEGKARYFDLVAMDPLPKKK